MTWARRRRRIRLHMKDQGPSLEGLLIGREAGCYRLAIVEVKESPGRSHTLDGEVMVPATNVAFYQLLGDAS